jgi:hypothetical protein
LTGHVTKVYVSDSNQIMIAYWSVYSDFSPTLYFLPDRYHYKEQRVSDVDCNSQHGVLSIYKVLWC